eukprot:tig00001030_g6447.t1
MPRKRTSLAVEVSGAPPDPYSYGLPTPLSMPGPSLRRSPMSMPVLISPGPEMLVAPTPSTSKSAAPGYPLSPYPLSPGPADAGAEAGGPCSEVCRERTERHRRGIEQLRNKVAALQHQAAVDRKLVEAQDSLIASLRHRLRQAGLENGPSPPPASERERAPGCTCGPPCAACAGAGPASPTKRPARAERQRAPLAHSAPAAAPFAHEEDARLPPIQGGSPQSPEPCAPALAPPTPPSKIPRGVCRPSAAVAAEEGLRGGREAARAKLEQRRLAKELKTAREENDALRLRVRSLADRLRVAEEKGGRLEGGGSVTVATVRASELCLAAASGDLIRITELAEAGVPLSGPDYDRRTPLHVAAGEGQLAAMGLLLDLGADTEARDRMGQTPLMAAVVAGRPEAARFLRDRPLGRRRSTLSGEELAAAEAAVEAQEDAALCAWLLIGAAKRGDLDALNALMDSGLDINTPDYDRRTALHAAATEGLLEVVHLLLEEGAAVNAVDRWNQTPVTEAIRMEHHQVLSALRAKGGVTYAELKAGPSAVATAAGQLGAAAPRARRGSVGYHDSAVFSPPRGGRHRLASISSEATGATEAAELAEAAQSAADTSAGEALCKAAFKGDIRRLRELIRRGYDPKSGDYDRRTALHVAAAEGQRKMVEELLALGVPVNARDRWGSTPLEDAVRAKHSSVAQALRFRGGKTSVELDFGEGPAAAGTASPAHGPRAAPRRVSSGHAPHGPGHAESHAAGLAARLGHIPGLSAPPSPSAGPPPPRRPAPLPGGGAGAGPGRGLPGAGGVPDEEFTELFVEGVALGTAWRLREALEQRGPPSVRALATTVEKLQRLLWHVETLTQEVEWGDLGRAMEKCCCDLTGAELASLHFADHARGLCLPYPPHARPEADPAEAAPEAVTIGRGGLGHCAASGEPQRPPRPAALASLDPAVDHIKGNLPASVMYVPFFDPETQRVAGVVRVANKGGTATGLRPPCFTRVDEQLLTVLLKQFAASSARAAQHHGLRSALASLQELTSDAARCVVAGLKGGEPFRPLEELLARSAELLRCEKIVVYFAEKPGAPPNGQQLVDPLSRLLSGFRAIPAHEGILSRVYTSGQIMNVRDAASDRRLARALWEDPALKHLSLRTMLLAPLRAPARGGPGLVVGVVHAFNRRPEGAEFATEEAEVLAGLCSFALSALSARAPAALADATYAHSVPGRILAALHSTLSVITA